MTINNISNLTILQLSSEIYNNNISISDLVTYYFKQIKQKNKKLNAFITLTENNAYDRAKILEKNISKNKSLSPLYGIPFSIKDIIYAQNVLCTAGTGKLFNILPSKDSDVVKKLKKTGGILLGTNTLNKFASGITGTNSICGNSKNPRDINRISGGSSGGSAVAVASGMIPFSIGTDTGGSIRVPASLCGVSGFKPTYGLINNTGVIDLSPSLDHVGIITKTVSDILLILKQIVNGHKNKILSNKISKKQNSLVVGIPINYFLYLESDVENVIFDTINYIKNYGIDVVNVNIGNHRKINSAWSVIRFVESSYVHMKILDNNYNKYGNDLKKMIEKGKKISGIDYVRSICFRDKIKIEFLKLFKQINFLILPTTIISAPNFNEKYILIRKKKFTVREALIRNNILFNLIGFPSLSIPIGMTKKNLPVGLQIVGKPYDDYNVLNFGNLCQLYSTKLKSNKL
ncbi:MAG: amidase [Nitrososphaeraceae archaeon]